MSAASSSPSGALPTTAELRAPSTWRSIDFISDLHLDASDPATFAAWQHYLETTPADALFILGDLFEVWVGDDVLNAQGFEAQCAALLHQTAQRLALFFMPGNRDFLLGSAMLTACQATGLPDPVVLTFPTGDPASKPSRWLLSHGDALCLQDSAYLRFRQTVRSTAWQETFLAQPLAARQAQARALREQSQAQHAQRQVQGMADVDVDDSAAREWLQATQAQVLIHGHTHKPAVHDLGQALQRVVLSDWHAGGGVQRGDVLRLSSQGLLRMSTFLR